MPEARVFCGGDSLQDLLKKGIVRIDLKERGRVNIAYYILALICLRPLFVCMLTLRS